MSLSQHHYDILNYVTPMIASSHNREFIQHSQNTVQWAGVRSSNVDIPTVDSLSPKNGNILIAAFTHEIERGAGSNLQPHDFQSYSLYKQASHTRSSEIMHDIMTKLKTPIEISSEITKMIKNSANVNECDEKTLIIREADVLSFFALSLPFFFVQRLSDKVLQELCIWEFKKLTPKAKKYLARFKFTDLRLKYYVNAMFSESVG